jgi:hypothetical protein
MAELKNRTVFMAIGSCVLLARQKVVNGKLEVWESRIFTQAEFKRISQVRFGIEKDSST